MDADNLSNSGSDHHHEDIDVDGPTVEVVYPLNERTEVPKTNGQLFKTVLVEGTGARPPKGAKVSVHYVGTLESDGSKFDSSRDRGDLFDFTLGQGQVIKGWDSGVATMRIGEKAILRCLPEYAYGAAGSPPKIPANSTLLFEVELFDWTKSEDVSEAKDKSVMKSVVAEGSDWEKPDYETRCVADVSVLTAGPAPGKEGTLLGSKQNWEFVIGETELPPGLELALKSMKKGEVAIFDVAAKLAQQPAAGEDSGWFKFIPVGERFAYKVSLKEFTKVKTWEVKGAAKVEAGRLRKDQGNEYFKQKRYAQAIAKYKRSLEFIEHDYGLEGVDKEEAAKLKITVLSNLAQAQLSSGDVKEAIVYCNKCLDADPSNVKAFFRRGKCFNQLDKWEESRADLKHVLELDAANAEARNELALLEGKIRAQRQKEKALYGNMFQKLADMEHREAIKCGPVPAALAAPEVPALIEEEAHHGSE